MLMQLRRACSEHKSEWFKGQRGHSEPLISHLYLFISAKLFVRKWLVFRVWRVCFLLAYCLLVLGRHGLIASNEHRNFWCHDQHRNTICQTNAHVCACLHACMHVCVCTLWGVMLLVQDLSNTMWPLLILPHSAGAALHRARYLSGWNLLLVSLLYKWPLSLLQTDTKTLSYRKIANM